MRYRVKLKHTLDFTIDNAESHADAEQKARAMLRSPKDYTTSSVEVIEPEAVEMSPDSLVVVGQEAG